MRTISLNLARRLARSASLATVGTLLLCAAASAQVNVHGQMLMPGGDLPQNPIKFDLASDDATYHDIRFTDSNGRFILERLSGQMGYTIFVRSDGFSYGDTTHKFVPEYEDTPRFYLNPYIPPKSAKGTSVSAAAARNKPDPKAADLHDRGMQALKDGHADQATTLLESAVQADPKYSQAFNDLGVVQMRAAKFTEAERNFRKGIEIDPKSPSLQANLGESLNHQKKYKDAIPPLREALRLMPDFAGAHVQQGVALVETDDLVEAKRELELAQTQEGDKAESDALLQLYLGDLYARTGDFPKGVVALRLYLKLAPNAPNAASVKTLIDRMQQALDKQHL